MGRPRRLWKSKLFLALVPTVIAFTAPPAAALPADRGGPGRVGSGHGAPNQSYISFRDGRGHFPLVEDGRAAPLVVSGADHPGVVRVAGDLRADIERVSGVRPALSADGTVPSGSAVVIIGTIGESPLIDRLVSSGKLDVRDVEGKWETTLEQVVDHPMPGVRRAFVIAGSDQRGTIYGAYDVSRNIGVSPWYFWADVPSPRHGDIYVKPGRHTQGTPAVKYRGFFINDENPALNRWAPRFFGPGKAEGYPNGFNHEFYAKIFETMLRLKANYLWPAVWGRAFAEDDPLNHATAKKYGVVMGTSHEAPMMRGIEEWNRHATPAERDADGDITKPGSDPYGGTGEWSFRRNSDAIKQYWRDGVERMVEEDFEGVVTIGMRGNGDVSLPDGDGIELMQNIIASERDILADVTGKEASETPQVWTLYKEVQRYWDRGMRVPDDVTVVFTDDNWGNMRKMPAKGLPERAGGYGLYYHFDYVGGGRNYKWVDTAQLANTWEQLHQSYQYGIRNLWVANVGDMKSNELPTQFFLDYAWDPDRWPLHKLGEWEREFAAQNFGSGHAKEIGEVLGEYGNLQALRKPELLNRRITLDPEKDLSTDPSAVVYDDEETPFYLNQYREMDGVTARWQRLAEKAERIRRRLPEEYRDAYYQLVYYQVKATANLYALREAEFTNILYAEQGRAATNDYADEAEARFDEDQAMSRYYDHELAGGKWEGFQSQPKIGYGNVARYGPNAPWQQPEKDHVALPDEIYPHLKRIEVPDGSEMGVAIDGSDEWWPKAETEAVLPEFSPYQSAPPQYIEVFNRGTDPFDYRITPGEPWVKVSHAEGRVDEQVRATVWIDWRRAPKGTTRVPIEVAGADGRTVTVQAVVDKPEPSRARGFVEAGGYVSMDADGFTRATGAGGAHWKRIPGIGRTDAGMEPFPVTASSQEPGKGPRLEYDMTLTTTGPVKVWAYLSPRNSVLSTGGLEYAVSIDGQEPQVVNITEATGANDTTMNKQWERNTSDNVNRTVTTHTVTGPGTHTLKFWMVDPTVVLQKIVVDTGGLRTSYLGPPESRRAGFR
ncbi:glycosyl hydrolase 115 family protein [Actinomadura sp. 7K534]|uniref:glycosyl hydrolase 115 family protein n=1 Tax=Actinomadura sp. 7K534 TaxID=2530366 RepID=UPI00104D8237|nr:glycosyl hydrolase 115 family protein [Actinomadura sp. 7K534]TDB94271.1 glycosyl hydrolase [Actinomadura sp. 7K534]